MVKKIDFFHGAVIHRFLSNTEIIIKKHDIASTYLLNDKAVYIKYSSNRISPWTFTFNEKHVEDIESLYKEYGEVTFALLCNEDGIVLIDYEEFRKLIAIYSSKFPKWIKANRQKREKYTVTGSDGALTYKIGENRLKEFFEVQNVV